MAVAVEVVVDWGWWCIGGAIVGGWVTALRGGLGTRSSWETGNGEYGSRNYYVGNLVRGPVGRV